MRIAQESFFAAFCDANVTSFDVSDYEKADFIGDIQDELSPAHHGIADFVFDGGSLDNIFDTAATLRNISRMLKPGGRFLAHNTGGPHPMAYTKFSADWFMDFFAINRYRDCKTYISHVPNTLGLSFKEQRRPHELRHSPFAAVVYSFNPYVTHSHGEGYDCSSIEVQARCQIYCLAEKGEHSTDNRNPIQKHYRVDPEHNRICNESAQRFLHSPRPTFSNPIPLDPATVPRIDSSDYPEQLLPVAVLNREYVSDIMSADNAVVVQAIGLRAIPDHKIPWLIESNSV